MIDIPTVITTLVSSGAISYGATRWLTTRLIDHRLAKDLKYYQEDLDEKLATSKAALDTQLTTVKAQLEASLRKGVEEYLGDKSAERQYRLDAQKRLYTAVGPLRFQLIIACREFVNRVERIGSGEQHYSVSLKGYFGRSTMFRLLRLFALAELIDRQMAYADFSVDPSTVELLRFKQQAYRCLSSSTISLDHPNSNWNEQVEHVFYDALSMISVAMIVEGSEGTPTRVMRFHELDTHVLDKKWLDTIHPIPRLMENFTVDSKPILWVRFVALAQLCDSFVQSEGPRVGIAPEPYDSAKILRASRDEFVTTHHDEYVQMIHEVSCAPIRIV